MTRASDKVSVALPTPRSTKKPLRFNHLTTTGFYGVQPIMYRELIVKESIKGSASVFVRSNPLVLPVMTGIRFNYHKFFVRYKDVFPAWDDFDTGSIHYFVSTRQRTFVTSTPYTTHAELASWFVHTGHVLDVTSAYNGDNSTPYDFVMVAGGNNSYYRFQSSGYRLNKLLNSLGIIIIWDDTCEEKISLMPLLCFAKAYCDWYIPNQYINSDPRLVDIQNIFTTDTNFVFAPIFSQNTAPYAYWLEQFCLYQWFSFFDDNDLYAAWDNPTGPVGNSLPSIELKDNSNSYPFNVSGAQRESVNFNQVDNYHNSNGTPSVVSDVTNAAGDATFNSSYVSRLNQYILDSLRHVTNAVRRMQLVGARNVDRFLAKYGIKLNDDHRAMLLGSQTLSLNVGDVEANSDGTNGVHQSNLGDLAGKGVTLGDVDFECSSGSHQGLFMILCSTLADTSLVQGFDPMWIHTVPNDYYQPDFDHLGTAAIPKYAVFTTQDGSYSNGADGVFGYMPRYYEYNLNRDLLTGAFRTHSQGSSELMGYHTYRLFGDHISYPDLVHSLAFLTPDLVDQVLTNRVFYNDNLRDQFIMRWRCNFVSTSPKRPLKDVYDWGDDEKNGLLDMHSTTANVQ